MRIVIGIGLLLLSLLVQAQAPRLLHAGFFGGGGDDRIEGAAFAPDTSTPSSPQPMSRTSPSPVGPLLSTATTRRSMPSATTNAARPLFCTSTPT